MTIEKNPLKDTTRGGQVFLHNLRMIGQVLNQVIFLTLPIACLVGAAWFVMITDNESRFMGKQWLSAQAHLLIQGAHFQQTYPLSDGRVMTVTSGDILKTPFIQAAVDRLTEAGKRCVWVSVIAWFLSIVTVLMLLRRSGNAYRKNKSIQGDYLGNTADIKQLIQQQKQQQKRESDLILGEEKLPLPLFAELQHFLVHGTTGCGKSTVIKVLLDHIRRRGERAIVYDKSCNLVSQFWQPQTDQLMNPLDERGADWSLWGECRDKTDFENLAAALIPMTPTAQDPFWVNAARTIFAAAAFRMRSERNEEEREKKTEKEKKQEKIDPADKKDSGNKENKKNTEGGKDEKNGSHEKHKKNEKNEKPKIVSLLRYLLAADMEELQSLLRGTEAESLISEKTEKTAISIKSVLATYLKSLCYIKEGDQPFSIRQWIQSDTAKQWLFISSLGDKHESLKPLITTWLDIAINALLSLPEHPDRRIWIILDELGSLQQLPYLASALSEARKFGGCFVIGIQSYAQLATTYGYEGGKVISSLLNTRFMFRAPDPDIAQWSAKNLGETTLEEVREGISYGANTMRDGVSIQRVERQKPVVPHSEIMRLPDLRCYVRLPGAYPITQINMPYVVRPILQPAFIPRVFDPESLRSDLDNMVKRAEKVKKTEKEGEIKKMRKKSASKAVDTTETTKDERKQRVSPKKIKKVELDPIFD
jgi:type IV secretory pathway TraG/TraD family ATPase VirD4